MGLCQNGIRQLLIYLNLVPVLCRHQGVIPKTLLRGTNVANNYMVSSNLEGRLICECHQCTNAMKMRGYKIHVGIMICKLILLSSWRIAGMLIWLVDEFASHYDTF